MLETPNVPWSYLVPMLILIIGAVVGLGAIAFVRRRFPAYVAAGATVAVASASLISIVPLWNRVGNPSEGAISAVSGAIGFVGLVLPHAVSVLTGPAHRRLLPVAAVTGACRPRRW